MTFFTPMDGFQRSALRRAVALITGALLCFVLLPVLGARADTPTTLTVVGTSDVQDSGLMPLLVTPMFEKAFPQFTLKYVSVGTGVAINDAESGVASALLVHAASLENQFVAQGYSKERYGRAIFYGDYVLLGPASDPAGVLSNAPHDIAGAFARIAAAGAANKADFVSRGGTPGTTVQEHAIWALDGSAPGLTMCTVSAANGGGMAPSTAGGSCPTTASHPSWYHTTGLTQGPNIEAANTCNFPNASGGNDCYVFTDRGTFECLMTAACAGGTAAPSNLKIVTRDNSAAAPGGSTVLINSFHAYAINPAKFAGNPNVQINSVAAEDFLNFITSPSFQAELKNFLSSDPPFIADAAPSITPTRRFPREVRGGQKVTVTGRIANLVPGTPPLNGVPVSVSEVVSGVAAGVPVASGRTDANGSYKITFSPPSTGLYQVSTGQILKVENSGLNPVFGDILQPAATSPSKITVRGVIAGLSVTALPGGVLTTGTVLPGADHVKGSVTLLARSGNGGPFRKVASATLGSDDHAFALSTPRSPGKWSFEVRFGDPGQVVGTTTKPKRVSVPPRDPASVSAGSVSIKNGRVTIRGSVGPKPLAAGTTVELLGLDVGALPTAKRAADAAAEGRVHFRVIAKTKLRAGATTFALHGRLRRGQRWILQLTYRAGGSAGSAFGGVRTVRVP
jgi:tungstate transport system substrate-binding protein